MALEFTNVVKGLITQTTLAALFERGGYRVTRLGIEELFGEIKHIEYEQYMGLNLPLGLRYLPDLLVAELDMSNAFMVEVKYRRRFDPKVLHRELSQQLEHWPQTHTVIMISEPFVADASFHQDYIRVLRPSDIEALDDSSAPEQKWEKMNHLQRVFKAFNNDRYALDWQKSADTLTQTLRDLANLEPID